MSEVTKTMLFKGRTVKVHTTNCVEVNLYLGLGMWAQKKIILEGVTKYNIPNKLRYQARHCLVVLLGGKRLLVHVQDPDTTDGMLVGRVYLDERVHGNPVGMAKPHGLDKEKLEVSTFYMSLGEKGFDVSDVKAVLNGNKQSHGKSV